MTSAERARRWREANRERSNATRREWYAKNKETRQAYMRQWREEHREEVRLYMKAYQRKRRAEDPEYVEKQRASLRGSYARNIEARRAASLEWAKRNPEKATALAQRYRARKLGAPGHYTAEEFTKLCADFNGRCFYCDEDTFLTADHVIPLSRGGDNFITNILPACKPCNSSKGPRTMEEFLGRRNIGAA